MKIRFKNLIVSALLGLCLLGSNSFGAMVLVKRALTQQAYATYSVATPGNAGKMDFGTLNQRPYGPKLAGWAMGWSAQNSWPMPASSLILPMGSAFRTARRRRPAA